MAVFEFIEIWYNLQRRHSSPRYFTPTEGEAQVNVQTERRLVDKVERDSRDSSTSLPSQAARGLWAMRTHWSIENQLHWVLDVAFREDASRVRVGDASEIVAVLRPIALNLIRHERSCKGGIQTKRLKAGWDVPYLLKVLHS
jgi:hypothetical protein